MSKTRLGGFAVALIVALSLVSQAFPEDFHYYVSYVIEEKYIIRNGGNASYPFLMGERYLGVFLNTSFQKVKVRRLNVLVGPPGEESPIQSPAKSINGTSGTAELNLPSELAPGEQLVIDAEFVVYVSAKIPPAIRPEDSGYLSDIDPSLAKYCAPVGPWNYTQNATGWDQVRAICKQIAGENYRERKVLDLVLAFVDWINRSIAYPRAPHETGWYPNTTILMREGDCDDQSNLLIAFCRMVGIPAYLQIGCVYLMGPEYETIVYSACEGHLSYRGSHIGWHGWAMIYVPPWGWLPFDTTWGVQLGGTLLSAVRHALVQSVNTVVYQNIVEEDYIAESLKGMHVMREYGIYVTEEENMRLLGIAPEYGPSSFQSIFITLSGIGFLVAGVVGIFLYARKKASSPPGYVKIPVY